MLILAAEANKSKDLGLYKDLRYQAFDTTGPNFHSVCLNLFASPCNDRLLTAVRKATKDEREPKHNKVEAPKTETVTKPQPPAPANEAQQLVPQYPWFQQMVPQAQSPLQGLYPQPQAFPYRGYGPQGGQGRQPGGFPKQRKYSCNFCGEEGHFLKDCKVLKKLKEKL